MIAYVKLVDLFKLVYFVISFWIETDGTFYTPYSHSKRSFSSFIYKQILSN